MYQAVFLFKIMLGKSKKSSYKSISSSRTIACDQMFFIKNELATIRLLRAIEKSIVNPLRIPIQEKTCVR